MLSRRLSFVVFAIAFGLLTTRVNATPTLYANNCAGCHSATVTSCNGCHAHGTHSTSAKNDINVAGTLDKSSYAPGETVTVTVTGGYRTSWLRVLLFDNAFTELARSSCPGGMGGCTTSVYPITLTAPAPQTPGTYTWSVAWYGNRYDAGGASFGLGFSDTLADGYFTLDPGNVNHGYQTVALPSFIVSPDATPQIAVTPGSLAFGLVVLGASRDLLVTISNSGTADLVGAVALGDGTSAAYSTSVTSFDVLPGNSQDVVVTYAPTSTSRDTGATGNDHSRQRNTVGLMAAAPGRSAPAARLVGSRCG